MSKTGISRRQFVAGAAVTAAATAMPLATNVTTAAAAPITFPQSVPGWTPLDATAAAREALEIYRGKRAGQSG